jgi:hypothetical protein
LGKGQAQCEEFMTYVLEATSVKKIPCSSLSSRITHSHGDAQVYGPDADGHETIGNGASSVTVRQ